MGLHTPESVEACREVSSLSSPGRGSRAEWLTRVSERSMSALSVRQGIDKLWTGRDEWGSAGELKSEDLFYTIVIRRWSAWRRWEWPSLLCSNRGSSVARKRSYLTRVFYCYIFLFCYGRNMKEVDFVAPWSWSDLVSTPVLLCGSSLRTCRIWMSIGRNKENVWHREGSCFSV